MGGRGASAPPVCAPRPQIKSYLSGNPPIRLGLSEDLVLGRRDARGWSAAPSADGELVVLDTFRRAWARGV